MRKSAHLWCMAVLLLLSSIVCAQPLSSDSASSIKDQGLAAYYHAAIGQSSDLYSGTEYIPHPANITGVAYYLNNDWNSGTVTYNNVIYHNVLMKYDLVDNQLIALLFNQFIPYVLNQTQVQSFHIRNHYFVYAAADSVQHAKESSFLSGFYEQVYNGPSAVLVRHEKTIETQTSSNTIESYYSDKTRLYIKNKGLYHEISGKGAIINLLNDQKKPVQQYIKSNHLKINKSSPEALAQVAAYYDSLTR